MIIDPILQRFIQETLRLKGPMEELYLFGSRARGDARPDSDYDVLIVLSRMDLEFKDALYDIVLDILLETGKVISLKFFKRTEFDRLRQIPTPFMEHIQKEGIKIG